MTILLKEGETVIADTGWGRVEYWILDERSRIGGGELGVEVDGDLPKSQTFSIG